MTVLGPDPRDWPPEWREELAERSALVEYLGKQPRARAEEQAERIVRSRAALLGPSWSASSQLGETRPEKR